MRGLSVEPLWGEVTLDLTGIDWVIVGGESGPSAEPFAVDWALHLREQCRTAGVAFFLKQLGRRPSFNGEPIRLADPHGGDWEAWPQADWRVRELPDFARLVQPPVVG
jgi:protein gp37